MTYKRVIPRDLFNEANLLKCYGQLALAIGELPHHAPVLLDHDGGPFEPLQQEGDGSLTLWPSVKLLVGGKHVPLHRPLNSREAWPLYATTPDGEEWSVFTDYGQLTDGFAQLLRGGA